MAAKRDPSRVLILGGGIAGLEALIALHHLAEDRADLALVAADPEFLYKPLLVEEPFTGEPAERHELAPILEEFGGRFLQAKVTAVVPDQHAVELDNGQRLEYDFLLACVGARQRPAFQHAETFGLGGKLFPVDGLLEQAAKDESRTLAFVVPPEVSWPLPIYELALMTRQRAELKGQGDVRLIVVTPEEAPLLVFGQIASDQIADQLKARHIEVLPHARVAESEAGVFTALPVPGRLDAGAVAALPALDGPALAGLPHLEGFIPIDNQARVHDTDDVYAAGDATTFPIKQGGLGTQQADAAAEDIAKRLGAPVEAKPFHPVLRGKLFVGGESLYLLHDLTGGHGEGVASPDRLWWPAQKVGGRFLAAWLGHEQPPATLENLSTPLDVEVALPTEWHEDPMALDPLSPSSWPSWG
jgi:sulfide:quinone oxidoreductase